MVRVLIVEDGPQTVKEIVAALYDHGFAVDSTGTGREELGQTEAEGYDAIVLDSMLPCGLYGLRARQPISESGSGKDSRPDQSTISCADGRFGQHQPALCAALAAPGRA